MRFGLYLLFIFALIAPINATIIPASMIKVDDGFIVAGILYSGSELRPTNEHALIMKIDTNGEEIWNKTYSNAAAYSIVRVSNGYAVGGVASTGADAWVVKVDDAGGILWEKTYGCVGVQDSAVSIVADDGGVLAPLTITWCDGSNRDLWLIKIDEKGREVWKKVFDFKKYDSIKMIKRTNDGGFIAVGAVSEDLVNLNYDVWVMKFDAYGNEEWNKFFDFGLQEVAWDVAEFGDSYVIVGGSWVMMSCFKCADSNSYDLNSTTIAKAFIISLDPNGNLKWKKFLEFGNISSAWSVAVSNGKIVVSGIAVNVTGRYVWISTPEKIIAIHGVDFNIVSAIYGPMRMVEVEDGYLVTISGCNGSCLWLGKFSFDGKLMWERKYEFLNYTQIEKEETKNNISSDIRIREDNKEGEDLGINKVLIENKSINSQRTASEFNFDPNLSYAIILILLAFLLAYLVSKF
ncbi:MAG: hypothetical protein NZ879_00915 [Archaeoglobaceae archaeon]|nr:hypothetical protein [Archaeoglobaceae archaeon]MDW8117527.1 hypothetical protein [Archaeoglobaceae archaeon]